MGFLHSITTRPWGHHHQYCSHSNPAVWLFGSCEGHQPRPEKKVGVSMAFLIHFLGPKDGFEAIPYLQTIKCNSCSSTPNNYNNLKLRGSRACTKDCIKTLLLNTRKLGSTFTEIRREWTSHNNWSFVTRCWLKNVHKSWILSLQDTGIAKTFIATHNFWPEGAWMPQTDFCIIGLRSKYHPATHQPQPFQTSNRLALHACV